MSEGSIHKPYAVTEFLSVEGLARKVREVLDE